MIRSLHCAVFLLLVAEFEGGNYTEKYVTVDEKNYRFQNRQPKLFTFDSTNGDISVELAFNVPFITVPVKKSLDFAKGAVANVNVGAIILSGALVFVFLGLFPVISLLLSKKMLYSPNSAYRNTENQFVWWDTLNNVLLEKKFDTAACTYKFLCSYVKNASVKVEKGIGSSTEKIVDGFVTNEWINQMLDGTTLQYALKKGLNGSNCAKEYPECKVNQRGLYDIMQDFARSLSPKDK